MSFRSLTNEEYALNPFFMLHYKKEKTHMMHGNGGYQVQDGNLFTPVVGGERLLRLNAELCYQCELKNFNSLSM